MFPRASGRMKDLEWSSQHFVTLLEVDKCIMPQWFPFLPRFELSTNHHSIDKPLSDGGISRSYSVVQLQTIPSVPGQFLALCMMPPASPDTSVWMRISPASLTTLLCVIVCLGCASLSCRSIHFSVFRLTVAYGCLGVGSCFGAASTAVRKYVKICSAMTTGTSDLWLHSLAATPPGPPAGLAKPYAGEYWSRPWFCLQGVLEFHCAASGQPASKHFPSMLFILCLQSCRIIWLNLALWVIKCSDCLCVFGTFLEQCNAAACTKSRILGCSSKCKLPKSSS